MLLAAGAPELRPQEVEGWGGFLASEERLAIAIAPLDEGLLLDEVALVAESPLFGQRVMQRRRREKSRDGGDNVIKNLTELREGAPVVHIDHGVGRYQGWSPSKSKARRRNSSCCSTPTRPNSTCRSPACI